MSCLRRGKGHGPDRSTVPFWLKPLSIFGLSSVTTFISSSHLLTILPNPSSRPPRCWQSQRAPRGVVAARTSEASIVPGASHHWIAPVACPGRVPRAEPRVGSRQVGPNSYACSLVSHSPLRTGHAACNCTRLSSACMPLTRLAWHRMWRSASRIPPLSPATDTWSPSPCDWLSQSPWWDVTPTTTTRPPSPWLSRAVGDPTFPRR